MVHQIPGSKGKLRELSLEQRSENLDLTQTFKIIHGFDRVSAETWFKSIDEERQHRTRMAEAGLCLAGQRARTDLRSNLYSHLVVQKWNGLPAELQQMGLVEAFKFKLKSLGHHAEHAL